MCPECEEPISRFADYCPYCGWDPENERNHKGWKVIKWFVIIPFLLYLLSIFIGIIVGFDGNFNSIKTLLLGPEGYGGSGLVAAIAILYYIRRFFKTGFYRYALCVPVMFFLTAALGGAFISWGICITFILIMNKNSNGRYFLGG